MYERCGGYHDTASINPSALTFFIPKLVRTCLMSLTTCISYSGYWLSRVAPATSFHWTIATLIYEPELRTGEFAHTLENNDESSISCLSFYLSAMPVYTYARIYVYTRIRGRQNILPVLISRNILRSSLLRCRTNEMESTETSPGFYFSTRPRAADAVCSLYCSSKLNMAFPNAIVDLLLTTLIRLPIKRISSNIAFRHIIISGEYISVYRYTTRAHASSQPQVLRVPNIGQIVYLLLVAHKFDNFSRSHMETVNNCARTLASRFGFNSTLSYRGKFFQAKQSLFRSKFVADVGNKNFSISL